MGCSYGLHGLLVLIVSLASTTTGIIVLAKHRSRTRLAPRAAIIPAALALVIALFTIGDVAFGIVDFIITFVLAVPALIMLALALRREKHQP